MGIVYLLEYLGSDCAPDHLFMMMTYPCGMLLLWYDLPVELLNPVSASRSNAGFTSWPASVNT